jgi:hypothetical protein
LASPPPLQPNALIIFPRMDAKLYSGQGLQGIYDWKPATDIEFWSSIVIGWLIG